MKVKLKTAMADPTGSYIAGSILTVSEDEAKQLVGLNYAEYLEPISDTSGVDENDPENGSGKAGKNKGKSKKDGE